MTYAEALAQLQALEASLPTLACQGHCTECCGPLGMSQLEFVRVRRATPLRLAESQTPTCPLLKRGRCTVYAVRPLICRLWGIVETMPCPWGCRPARFLTMEEGDVLMREVAQLSQTLFPDAPARTMHTSEMIEQVQERGAKAVAWAILASMEPVR